MITATVRVFANVCAFPVFSQELSEGLMRGEAEISRDVGKKKVMGYVSQESRMGTTYKEKENQRRDREGRYSGANER